MPSSGQALCPPGGTPPHHAPSFLCSPLPASGFLLPEAPGAHRSLGGQFLAGVGVASMLSNFMSLAGSGVRGSLHRPSPSLAKTGVRAVLRVCNCLHGTVHPAVWTPGARWQCEMMV